MNILSKHIEILLLDHDCVIVPRIGGFISNQESARYEDQEKLFLPPFRSVAFNNKLTVNDGLLVQSYMQAYDAAYPEALRQLEKDVDSLILQLDTTGQYTVGSVGTLTKDIEGRITLQTTEAGILSPAYYGLYSLSCRSVDELQKERETASVLSQTNILPIQTENDLLSNINTANDSADNVGSPTDEGKKNQDDSDIKVIHLSSFFRRIADMGIAAVVAGVLFTMLSISTMNVNDSEVEVYVASAVPVATTPKQTAKPVVEQNVPVAKEVETKVEVVKPIAEAQNTESYTIVMASYVTEANANIYIEKLAKQGFNEAQFVKGKVSRIHYGTYSSQEEAVDKLRKLRSQNSDFAQAWTMKLKN